MKSISVSDKTHKWIMDHKDRDHNSANEVLEEVICNNEELIKNVDELYKRIDHCKK